MSRRKRIVDPDVRVHQNPVTHQMEYTRRDAVQKAFEKITRFIDSRTIRLSNADAERLARRLHEYVSRMLPRTDAGNVVQVPPELARAVRLACANENGNVAVSDDDGEP